MTSSEGLPSAPIGVWVVEGVIGVVISVPLLKQQTSCRILDRVRAATSLLALNSYATNSQG